MRYAICLGLTRLNPDAYSGWEGDCPGCDVDAANFARLCHDSGFDAVSVFINASVTHEMIHSAFKDACGKVEKGDLLVLYNSGHGGQIPDKSGDEEDSLDETLCWWNGELSDDDIGRYLQMIPEGVRVLFVTDTCNSGTNFKAKPKHKRSRPVVLNNSAKDLKCELLHFGGCADGHYSYGTEDGGVFTNALLRAHKSSRKKLTYGEWFKRACKRMPRNQVPVVGLFGEDFLELEMLT